MKNKQSETTEVLGAGKWLRLVKSGTWEWVQRTNATGVVGIYAFTDNDEVVLVEQPRRSMNSQPVLEIPAGLAGDVQGQEDEKMESAAHRELLEETGYESGELRAIAEVPSSPGMSEETIVLYVARQLIKVGPGGGDSTEDITVVLVPMDGFFNYIHKRTAEGRWIDPKVFAVPYFHQL